MLSIIDLYRLKREVKRYRNVLKLCFKMTMFGVC